MLAQIGALEAKLTTLEEKNKMNWLKRKLTNFFNSLPPANYDMNSPLGFGGMI